MTALRTVAIATISALTLLSCTKEDFPPSAERQAGTERTIIKTPSDDPVEPIATATVRPCGYGFYVDISYLGVPMEGTYNYEVRLAGTGIVVDSGEITNGGHTNWNMSPCTEYDFRFFGMASNPNHSTIQTVRTEGCNGQFDC